MNGRNQEMKEPLVTIIVPVYNIEKYIDACISSIVNQTYKNIEIIIVDDGSIDQSGVLSDAWRKKDQRVKVIHQKNQGTSVARNTAMRVCSGEYIIFVDGDDIISCDMIEKLLNAKKKTNADCIFCQYDIIPENAIKFDNVKEVEKDIYVADTEEAQLRLLNHIDVTVVWDGSYQTKLIKNLFFDKGKKNEDIKWRCLATDKCKKIAYISDKLYGYRMRGDSLMHQKYSLKDFDDIEGVVSRAEYIIEKYETLKCPAITDIIAYCMEHYIKTLKFINGNDKKEALKKIKEYRKTYKITFFEILKAKNISKERKFSTALACISFPLACYIKSYILNKKMMRINALST